jgi:hypothetical protein
LTPMAAPASPPPTSTTPERPPRPARPTRPDGGTQLGLTSPVSGPAGHRSAEELSADGLDELYLTPMATPVAPPSTSTAPERSPRQRDRLQPHCNGQHDPRDRAEVHNDSRG